MTLNDTNLDRDTTPRKVLWGVAPTGDVCINYLPNIALLKQLKSKGSKIVILIADFHGYWDSEKTSYEKIEERVNYYEQVFKLNFGFDDSEIVKASDFYLRRDYVTMFYQYSNLFNCNGLLNSADRTLANFNHKEYFFSDLLYVFTQIVDLVYLDIDCVICGEDESGIYKLGIPILTEKLSKNISFIYTKMIEGVINSEMHSSDSENNKVLLTDSVDVVKAKLLKSPNLLKTVKEYILPLWGYDDNELISEKYAEILVSLYNEPKKK